MGSVVTKAKKAIKIIKDASNSSEPSRFFDRKFDDIFENGNGDEIVNEIVKNYFNDEELKKSGVNFSFDEHGHPELGKVSKAHIFSEMVEAKLKQLNISTKIRPVEIGYEVRCQQPVAFDLVYCTRLGMGVYQLFKSGETGCMVYINEYGDAKPLYLKDTQDPQTGKIPPRGVNINSEKIQAIFDNIMHYVTEEDYAAAKEIVADPSEYDFKKILNW